MRAFSFIALLLYTSIAGAAEVHLQLLQLEQQRGKPVRQGAQVSDRGLSPINKL